jgi:hypothetical protein
MPHTEEGTLPIQKDPVGNPLSNIRYFYGYGKTREKIKKGERKRKQSLLYQFVKFFDMENMKELGVLF